MPPIVLTTAFALCSLACGTLSTYLYEEDTPLAWRTAAGACTAFAALGLLGFAAAFALPISAAFWLVTLTALIMTACLVARADVRRSAWRDVRGIILQLRAAVDQPHVAVAGLFALAAALAFSWAVIDRVLYVRSDGWHTGVMNNFGDLPFHLGVIARFAAGANVPPENPIYANVPFTYPFLADFITSMPVAAGAGIRQAMLAQNLVLLWAFAILLYYWAFQLTRDRMAAVLSCVLVFASGGLGWWMLLAELGNGAGLVSTLGHLSHDYTVINRTTWRWGNVITALLIPQRSLLLGLPVALVALTLVGRDFMDQAENPKLANRRLIAGGAITGLLPLVHAHSFMVVAGVAACLSLAFRRLRRSLPFFVAVAVVGLPQLAWSARHTAIDAAGFTGWQFGWDRGSDDAVWFWIKNTGAFIPLVIAAFAWSRTRVRLPRRVIVWYLPFTLCFVVPNVIRLAPWIWDNIKVLIYWFVASAPFAALVLAELWRRRSVGARVLAGFLVVSLTLAGALDVWRVVSHAADAPLFDSAAVAFAEQLERDLSVNALVLHAPVQNHPVFLTGRRSFMGYPGHVWSHGLDASTRESEIRQIYAGAPNARDLLARRGIDYVVIGPVERLMLHPQTEFFAEYPVKRTGEFDVYRITSNTR